MAQNVASGCFSLLALSDASLRFCWWEAIARLVMSTSEWLQPGRRDTAVIAFFTASGPSNSAAGGPFRLRLPQREPKALELAEL